VFLLFSSFRDEKRISLFLGLLTFKKGTFLFHQISFDLENEELFIFRCQHVSLYFVILFKSLNNGIKTSYKFNFVMKFIRLFMKHDFVYENWCIIWFYKFKHLSRYWYFFISKKTSQMIITEWKFNNVLTQNSLFLWYKMILYFE